MYPNTTKTGQLGTVLALLIHWQEEHSTIYGLLACEGGEKGKGREGGKKREEKKKYGKK